MAVAPVEGVEIADVRGVGRPEGVGVDRPSRGVLGVAMTMLFQQSVEELEELSRGPEIPQRVLERVVRDRLIDQLAESRPAVAYCWKARSRRL